MPRAAWVVWVVATLASLAAPRRALAQTGAAESRANQPRANTAGAPAAHAPSSAAQSDPNQKQPLDAGAGTSKAAEEKPASAPPTSSSEEKAPASAADDAQATASARRHFRVGVKLYRDANYAGALAEFDAAYHDRPGAGSLQNMALCQKALFRYAEAASTLKLLLARHADELSAPEREAMQQAIVELEGLVGTLNVTTAPERATVSVDGRVIPHAELAQGLSLNVGEHLLLVEAPGYERDARVVRIASLQRLPLSIELKANSGFIGVTASDPKAAIAIDDEPLAYKSWFGPVSPDVDHVVQVYREGFETFERTVRVELGETVEIQAELGAPTGVVDEQAPLPEKPSPPPRAKKPTGYYALASLGIVGLNDAPLNLEVQGQSARLALPTFGLRAGYRLADPIAIELAFDYGQLDDTGACEPATNASMNCIAHRNFSLRSLRFGTNLRLMTHGEVLRFVTSVGAGIVRHTLKLDASTSEDGNMTKLAGGSASGVDPYFSLELGGAANYHHVLGELAVVAFVEGASGLRGSFDQPAQTAVFSNGTLPMIGVVLKLGYSSWAPR